MPKKIDSKVKERHEFLHIGAGFRGGGLTPTPPCAPGYEPGPRTTHGAASATLTTTPAVRAGW